MRYTTGDIAIYPFVLCFASACHGTTGTGVGAPLLVYFLERIESRIYSLNV